MYRLTYLIMAVVMFLCMVMQSSAEELVRGKIMKLDDTSMVLRIKDGREREVRIRPETKIMHRAGTGEQAGPAKLTISAQVAAYLDGRTAVLVVVEEVPR
jgi:hypothetical protein